MYTGAVMALPAQKSGSLVDTAGTLEKYAVGSDKTTVLLAER